MELFHFLPNNSGPCFILMLNVAEKELENQSLSDKRCNVTGIWQLAF